MLTAKNLQCMRSILSVAHCYGNLLGQSWHIILTTLQHLVWILDKFQQVWSLKRRSLQSGYIQAFLGHDSLQISKNTTKSWSLQVWILGLKPVAGGGLSSSSSSSGGGGGAGSSAGSAGASNQSGEDVTSLSTNSDRSGHNHEAW